MKSEEQIATLRLHNQRLIGDSSLKNPAKVVQWLVAVQAQDYYGAKWGLGQRMRGASDEAIEQAFASGAILRTHVMRPTWHFVTPADIRWLLKLTAPRVDALNSHYYRKLELNAAVFKQTNKALARALRDGKHLTRKELREVISRAGIDPGDTVRMGHILCRAELEGVICSGPRKGKQFTYALLEERAAKAPDLSRDESLAELTARYFKSRGPATIPDFVWWSGLTSSDAKRGLEIVGNDLAKETIDGKEYWRSAAKRMPAPDLKRAYLLSPYDEYFIAYKDRSVTLDPQYTQQETIAKLIFDSVLVIGTRLVGGWKRELKNGSAVIQLKPFAPLTKGQKQLVKTAAERYGEFLGLRVVLA
jgi:hypothetical protein